MIKELIFSGKKYYEGQVPNYVGKVVQGLRGTITSFSLISTSGNLYVVNWDREDNVSQLNASQINGSEVLYQVNVGTNYLHQPNPKQLYLGFNCKNSSDTDYLCFVKLHDIIKNGGVSSSSLTHLYQSLRHLLNRKVALV